MSKVNEELSKLAQERGATQRQLVMMSAQLEQQKQLAKKSEFTLKDLSDMPEDVVAYRAVGRMFMMDDTSNIKKELKDIMEQASAEVVKLEKSKTVMEQRVQEVEKSMKEILATRQ